LPANQILQGRIAHPSVSVLPETTKPDLITEGVKGLTHAIPVPDSGPRGAR
jgi:hypothetical protein